jgi:hypothetical protein
MNLKDVGAVTSRLTHPTACHSGARAALGTSGLEGVIGEMQAYHRATAANLAAQLGGPEASQGMSR